MNSTTNKKDIFYIIVLILTFITVIVGATFALYTFIFSQEEGTSAVYTGTFSIEYLSGDIISFNLLYPTEKPAIDEEKNVYKNNFRVTNNGTLDGEITEIVIEISKNEFEEERIKIEKETSKAEEIILRYSLYNKDKEEVSDGYIEDIVDKDGNTKAIIAQNLELKSNETEEYTLLIWLKDDGELQNEYMKKNFIGRIRVDAMQKKNFKITD